LRATIRQRKLTPQGRPPVFNPASDPPQKEYVVDVLVKLATGTQVSKDSSISSLHPPGPGDSGQVSVIPVLLSTIQSISQLRVKVPADLRSQGDKNTVYRALGEVMRRMPGGPTLLDPIKNMGITDKSFMDLVKVSHVRHANVARLTEQQIQLLEDKLNTLPITKDPKLPSLYDTYDRKLKAIEHVKSLKRKISSVHDVLQLEELKSRKRVLRRLGFTTSDDVVEMKGRVACEISSGDELLLTELMFGGTFNPLAPEHCAALLSCFAFQEKVSYSGRITGFADTSPKRP
jgi:ATP-dependent RNA helicase DOB1